MEGDNSIESISVEEPEEELSAILGDENVDDTILMVTDSTYLKIKDIYRKKNKFIDDMETSDEDNYNQTSDPFSDVSEDEGEEEEEEEEKEEREVFEESEPNVIERDQVTIRNVDLYLKKYIVEFLSVFQRRGQQRLVVDKRHFGHQTVTQMIVKLLEHTDVIQEYGLCQDHFDIVLDIILGFQGKKIRRKLVPLLVPRDKIPTYVFMRVISSINRGNERILENALIKWLCTVYPFTEDKEQLAKLYSVVFFNLKRKDIRATICNLLSHMTKENHVRKHRVNYILQLLESDKENTALLGLLRVYQQFNDKIIIPANVRIKKEVAFATPLPKISQRILKVQRLWKDGDETEGNREGFYLPNSFPKLRKVNNKRGQKMYDLTRPSTNIVIDARTVLQKALHLEKMKVNESVNSAADTQLLRQVITLNPDNDLIQRATSLFAFKISTSLQSDNDPEVLKEQFNTLLEFARFTKHHLSSVDSFIRKFVRNWSGYEHVDEVFEMISYINPLDYDALHNDFLKPLYRLFCVSKITWKTKMIQCFADLLKNWARLDWNVHLQRKEDPTTDIEDLTHSFNNLRVDVDYLQTIRKLIHFIDKMCVFGLVLEQDDPTLQHGSLSFFETVTSIYTEQRFPEITIPSPAFVYRQFFSKNSFAISRICGIISEYKKAFENYEKEENSWSFETTTEQMPAFNGYLTDICNALWMNKAFTQTEIANMRFQLSDEIIESLNDICNEHGDDLNQVGSIIQSPAMSGFAKRFFEKLENDMGVPVQLNNPITPESFSEVAEQGGISLTYFEFKREYLDYLSDLGFKGYHDLLFSSMVSLRRSRGRDSSVSS